TPIQARELRLLLRDRTFMVQTLLLPLIIIGAQLVFGARGNLFRGEHDPANVAALAFGVSTYALMFSAFQTLNAEGHALWILYTVPRPLESILRQKAVLWASVSSLYAIGILGFAATRGAGWSWRAAGISAVTLLGVPIYATIATSLGVFACDPLAQEVQR